MGIGRTCTVANNPADKASTLGETYVARLDINPDRQGKQLLTVSLEFLYSFSVFCSLFEQE
jgi:hypothetical protein